MSNSPTDTPDNIDSPRPKARRVIKSSELKTPEDIDRVGREMADSPAGLSVEDEKSYIELQNALESNDLAGGTLRLHRRGPMDSNFQFVCKMEIASFDLEQIRKMYGGGDYRAKFWRANGQIGGKEVNFSIDHRHKGILDTNHLPKEGSSAGDNQTLQLLTRAVVDGRREDPAMPTMITQMMKSQSDNMTLIMTMMMKSAEQQTTMMAQMMTAMASVFGAKNVTPVQAGLGMQDVVGLVTLLNQNKATTPGMSEIADVMLKLKELSGGGNGEGKEDEPKTLIDKIAGIMPHVANTVAALKGQAQIPVGDQPKLEDGKVVASQPEVKQQASGNQIQTLLAFIIEAARKKKDVTLYRDFLLDNLTDDEVDQLEQLLTAEAWFDTLFGALPDKEAIRPWMVDLRNSVISLLKQATQDGSHGNENTSGVQLGQDTVRTGTDS